MCYLEIFKEKKKQTKQLLILSFLKKASAANPVAAFPVPTSGYLSLGPSAANDDDTNDHAVCFSQSNFEKECNCMSEGISK